MVYSSVVVSHLPANAQALVKHIFIELVCNVQTGYILFVKLIIAVKVEVSDTTMSGKVLLPVPKKFYTLPNLFPQLTKISELSLII